MSSVIRERLLDLFGDGIALLRGDLGVDDGGAESLLSGFLTLPFEAVRELLGSDRLAVDSENTVVVRGVGPIS